MDLLPAWVPATQSAPATYIVYNEWTLSSAGWIDQYGVDILPANVGATHILTLRVNGVVKDTFTTIPNAAGIYWHDITPIVALSGAVVRVTLQVTRSGSNSWFQQTGLFATAPTYCSLAVGSKDGATAGTTAYGCHLLFTPGAASPDWDVVAYGGEAAGGSVADVTSWNGRTGAVTLTPADVRAASTGVIDGSDAAAGQVGEYKTASSAGFFAISSNTNSTVATLLLTEGDWDVWATVGVNPSLNAQFIQAGLATSVTFPGAGSLGLSSLSFNAAIMANPINLPVSQIRVSITVSTTYYLNIYVSFPSGTCSVGGNIAARRVR
jgi:hypothetical protein